MPRLSRITVGIGAIIILFTLHYFISSSSPSSTPYPPLSENDAIRSPDQLTRARPKHQTPKKATKLVPRPGRKGGEQVKTGSDAGLKVDERGLITYRAGGEGEGVRETGGKGEKHPIELLIERGRRLAESQERRIGEVESLDDSVDEYASTFGMQPPKGYDEWYKFTQRFSPAVPPLPSLYPLVHEPFLPLLAHPADLLRDRVEGLRNTSGMFTLTFVPDGTGDIGTACTTEQDWHPPDWHDRGKGRVIVRGQGAYLWRCNNTLTLMLPILPLMPKEFFTMDPPLEIAFSLADGPRSMIHNSFKERSESLARAGKVWSKAQLYKAEQNMRWTHGWQWACPEGSPLKVVNTDTVLNDIESSDQSLLGEKKGPVKTFIADFGAAADYCYNPGLMPFHHILLAEKHVGASHMAPCIVTCRSSHNADIVGVPLDAMFESVEYVPWEEKTLSKVFWRGSATGMHHSKDTLWRQSQRERLHFFAHNKTDESVAVLVDRSATGGGIEHEEFSGKEMNERWLDVGLSGKPVQCKVEDGTCDEMAEEIDFMGRVRKEDAVRFKIVIDVDGNGWSSRFRRLLLANNVVLKSTLYPEWFSDMLIPWYHYVPLKLDYTDMYDILAFFMGAPDGSTAGRDDLAQEIAANGLKFVEQKWRLEDMQSFMYLLFLEYWRLMADDRRAFTYVG